MRLVDTAGEAVEDRARRRAFGAKDVEGVVPRLASVDDEWELAFVGEFDSLQ